jgi:outer membrane lipoprotein-sorting protein
MMLAAAAMLPAQGRFQGGRGMGGFGSGPGMMAAWPGSRTPVTGAPYSGTQATQMQQTLANGNQITRQEQSKVYRDSQGRVRMEHSATNPATGAARVSITIFDPVAGFTYLLDPADKTVVKMPVRTPNGQGRPMEPMGAGRGTDKGQAQTEDLGTQTINGLTATGTRVTRTIPAGAIGNQQPIQIVRETWISTALKVPVQIKTSDPRFGNTTMQLTNVTQAEPDAALFQVPSDYTVETRGPGMGGRMRGGPRN